MDLSGEKRYEKLPQQVEDAARYAVDSAYRVHVKTGQGLLERTYEQFMEIELKNKGCRVKRQVKLPITYDGIEYDEYYTIDMLVDDCLIIELKAVENIIPVHKYQLITYLKLSGLRLGLLINFNTPNIGDGISRVII